MMTPDELKKKLQTTNRTSDEVEAIIAKYKKSLENKDAVKIQYKSTRRKIQELLDGLDPKDCRFFDWNEGVGIFVHRNGKKATVTFSFLNPADVGPDFEFNDRENRYYALVNFKAGKYTYEVDWKGRSEFAVYDAWVANHATFPGFHKNYSLCMGFREV